MTYSIANNLILSYGLLSASTESDMASETIPLSKTAFGTWLEDTSQIGINGVGFEYM